MIDIFVVLFYPYLFMVFVCFISRLIHVLLSSNLRRSLKFLLHRHPWNNGIFCLDLSCAYILFIFSRISSLLAGVFTFWFLLSVLHLPFMALRPFKAYHNTIATKYFIVNYTNDTSCTFSLYKFCSVNFFPKKLFGNFK